MRKDEYPHNAPEQVALYLRDALLLVATLDEEGVLPDDLRGIAFAKAVDLFSAKQIMFQGSPLAPALIGGRPL